MTPALVPARQRVAILGSTGSVGVSTLDVIARNPDAFEVAALTASTNVDTMVEQCARFDPRLVAMADDASAARLEAVLRQKGLRAQVIRSSSAIETIASDESVDTVMAAIVGAAGLAPCIAAARAGKRLLLANKEALVLGGEVFLGAVRSGGATLLPIDSEHSAIFQSLPEDPSAWSRRVRKIMLTASGGPFLERDPATLKDVTPAEACKHPNWSMGRKISVDSATMMNKALEVIEAHHLFALAPERIEVVLHPQSVVHSMVEYVDGSVVAQLGTPDMRVPIAVGLAWPERAASGAATLDFARMADWRFESIETPAHRARFPGLALAWQALAAPGGTTGVLNAANEVAVAAFLEGRLRFDRIHAVNLETLSAYRPSKPSNLADLLALDAEARAVAERETRRLH